MGLICIKGSFSFKHYFACREVSHHSVILHILHIGKNHTAICNHANKYC